MFAAPEALKGPFNGALNDVWAAGVVLYMLRFGPDREPEFRRGRLIWPCEREEDDDMRDLLEKMLERDPNRRCGIGWVAAHPFVGLRPALRAGDSEATIIGFPVVKGVGTAVRGWLARLTP